MKNIVAGFVMVVMLKAAGAQVSANGVLYVNTYKTLAMGEMRRSGIPAAIILAQGLHESEAGASELVKRSNNHFGIKCRDDWKGEVVYHDDDSRQECFRSYATAEDSYRDNSDFLRGSQRYASLFNLDQTDYEGWAYGLKKAGYATNVRYSQILIKLIKDYNLQQYTLICMGKMRPEDEVVLTAPGVAPGAGLAGVGAKVAGRDAVDSGTATGGAGGQRAEQSYPEGEFMINRTRVVYAGAGVSLLAIANQYEIPLGKLLEFNDLKEEDVLTRGQLLFLQRKRRTGAVESHVVQEGETWYEISQEEGVRLEDLLEMNLMSPGPAAGQQPATGERIYLQGSAPARPRLVSGPGSQYNNNHS
jgi:LysM repeat protein